MSARFPGSWVPIVLIGCALLGLFSSTRLVEAQRTPALFPAGAEISNTPAPAKKLPARNSQPALEPSTKRRARFLGATGLVIISLLVLATGIALLRSFRQR